MTAGRARGEPERREAAASALQDLWSAGDLRVCRASAGDVDRIAPLFDAYRQFYGAASDIAAARGFLAARFEWDESVVLLAIVRSSPPVDHPRDRNDAVSEDVIGFAQLYRSFSSLSLGGTVILNDLFVTPAQRGRGIAGRLVDAVAAYARGAGAIRLEVATQHTNHTALRLYRAKGFVEDTEFTRLSLVIAPRRSTSDGDDGT